MHTTRILTRRRPHGVALVYVIIVMTAMMGLTSLAVDVGRYELAHSQMYNAAVAAARAAAMAMSKTGATATSVTTAANTAATNNSADGQTITSGEVTVQFIKWVSAANYTIESTANFSQANAVRVYVSYNVPLVFGQIIGLTSKTAVEHSTAEFVLNTDTPYVYATGNLWLSGEPAGTHASQPDPNYAGYQVDKDHSYYDDVAGTPGAGMSTFSTAEPSASPVQIAFTVTPGATITITNTSGLVSYDHNTAVYVDPTGNGGTTWVCDDAKSGGVSEHGIADATMPIGSMNAVFLGSGLPDNIATPPPAVNFGTSSTQNYVGLQPQLQQPFYVGTGQTSTNQQQEIVVPANATRMFMGCMDAWEWDNNVGGFNCTVTQTNILTVE